LLDKIISQPLATSVRFLVVGDWGRDGFCCQRDVAHEMARAAATIRPNFVANSGDSFYEYGLESEFEEQVKTSWEHIYLKHDSLKQLEWFSVLGNHEYRGSVPAVLRVNKVNPKFVMSDRFYDHVFRSEDGSFSLHFFFIDTNPMIKAYHQSGYDDRADTMLNHKDGISTQWSRVDEQINWLSDGLNKSTAQVKVVMGHHPVFTSGSHYHEDELFLRNTLSPIFERNNVLVYFSGEFKQQLQHPHSKLTVDLTRA
jgi:tartrate-resistant acid phosphatase type 5